MITSYREGEQNQHCTHDNIHKHTMIYGPQQLNQTNRNDHVVCVDEDAADRQSQLAW